MSIVSDRNYKVSVFHGPQRLYEIGFFLPAKIFEERTHENIGDTAPDGFRLLFFGFAFFKLQHEADVYNYLNNLADNAPGEFCAQVMYFKRFGVSSDMVLEKLWMFCLFVRTDSFVSPETKDKIRDYFKLWSEPRKEFQVDLTWYNNIARNSEEELENRQKAIEVLNDRILYYRESGISGDLELIG